MDESTNPKPLLRPEVQQRSGGYYTRETAMDDSRKARQAIEQARKIVGVTDSQH